MRILDLHLWNLSPVQAVELQRRLAAKVSLSPVPAMPKVLVGLDCAFSPDKKYIIAAAVVLAVKTAGFEIIETAEAVEEVRFPYVPGLLSFREAPACLEALRKLQTMPEVILADGQGFAHPRRLGLASHLGLFLDAPTIGCAKSRLIGEPATELGPQKGACVDLLDKGRRSARLFAHAPTSSRCLFLRAIKLHIHRLWKLF